MKQGLTLLFLLVGFTFQAKAKDVAKRFCVVQIDSVHSYYIIYLTDGKYRYKLVSNKQTKRHVDYTIKLNHCYFFALKSIRSNHVIIIKGKKYYPLRLNEVSGLYFDDSTTISFDPESGRDLYTTQNLRGLSYVKRKK